MKKIKIRLALREIYKIFSYSQFSRAKQVKNLGVLKFSMRYAR